MKMGMSAICVTGDLEILETYNEIKILESAWSQENNVDWTAGNQSAWITRVMAVLTYGPPRVTLLHAQGTPTPTGWTEMMYPTEHTWMIREKDVDLLLIYNPREEKNPLPVTRNIFFPVRI
jgi:hypothetical protein